MVRRMSPSVRITGNLTGFWLRISFEVCSPGPCLFSRTDPFPVFPPSHVCWSGQPL
jgi:hypothetical protein